MRLKYAEDFYIRALLKKVKLKDVMTSPVIAVNVDAPFREVVKLLEDRRIRHVPIVDSKKGSSASYRSAIFIKYSRRIKMKTVFGFMIMI